MLVFTSDALDLKFENYVEDRLRAGGESFQENVADPIFNFATNPTAETFTDLVLAPYTGTVDVLEDLILNPLGDLLIKDVDLPTSSALKGTLLTIQGNDHYIPVIYGEDYVGGRIKFKGVSGTDNEYFHFVVEICEGEIEAIDEIWVDDFLSTDARWTVDSVNHCQTWSYTGTDTQAADAELVSTFAEWTSAHQLKGTAYVHLKLRWNSELFRGRPKLNFKVRGKKVYNADTTVTEYSTNPAWCIRDYLTNTRYGKGLSSAKIDDTSFIAAATECATTITDHSGSPSTTIAKYAINGVIDTGRTIKNNLDLMLTSCNGFLNDVGTVTLTLDIDSTSVFTFDEDNIIGNISTSGIRKKERFNRVKVNFKNPDREYQPDIGIFDSTTYRTNDSNALLEHKSSMPLENNIYRAIRRAQYLCNKSRNARSVILKSTFESYKVEKGNIVDITYSRFGWTNKPFRVSSISIEPSGLITYSLKFHDVAALSLDTPAVVDAVPATNLPDPFTVQPVTGLSAASGTSQLLVQADGTIITRVLLTWTLPADVFRDRYETQWKESADSTWLPGPIVADPNATSIYIQSLEDGTDHDFRVRTVNTQGFTSDWATFINHTIIGKTAPPPDVDSVSVTRLQNGDHYISWVYSSVPVDIGTYKVLVDSVVKHSGIRTLDFISDASELKTPGSYTVGIIAVDTTGNESGEVTTSYTRPSVPAVDSVSVSRLQNGDHYVTWVYGSQPIDIDSYEILVDGVVKHSGLRALNFVTDASELKTPGSYTVGVKAVDTSGNKSTETTSAYTRINMPDVASFIAAQNGATTVLRWSQVSDVGLSGYEIRYGLSGTTWANAVPLTKVTKGTNITTADIPPGTWDVLIKAVDTDGNYSTNAISDDVTVVNFNVAITDNEEAPDWLGTRNNLVKHWTGKLVPQSQDSDSTADDIFDEFVVRPVTSGYYESPEIDIDFDDEVRIWGDIGSALGPLETGTSDPELQIDYRTESGAYDGFESWTIGNRTGRYFKFRAVFDTSDGVYYLSGFENVVDNVEVTTEQEETITGSPAGQEAITFTTTYHTIPSVKPRYQGSAARIASADSVTTTGCTLYLFDTNGNPVNTSGAEVIKVEVTGT